MLKNHPHSEIRSPIMTLSMSHFPSLFLMKIDGKMTKNEKGENYTRDCLYNNFIQDSYITGQTLSLSHTLGVIYVTNRKLNKKHGKMTNKYTNTQMVLINMSLHQTFNDKNLKISAPDHHTAALGRCTICRTGGV